MAPNKKKIRGEESQFLQSLSEFLGDSEGQDLNDVKSELKEIGLDIDPFVLKIKGIIETKSTEAKREWMTEAKVGRAAALEEMKRCKLDIPEDTLTLIEKIKQIITGGESRELASVYFRNLKDMPYEDLKKLYEDYLKLQHLKKKKEDEEQAPR